MCLSESGGNFLLEKIRPEEAEYKEDTARIMSSLKNMGLDRIHPYCEFGEKDHVFKTSEGFFQIRPFAEGSPPERPAFIHDLEKARNSSAFLNELYALKNAPEAAAKRVFIFSAFLKGFREKLQTNSPELLSETKTELDFVLKIIPDAEKASPAVFCHGDFHPLNIVWKGDEISSVIDWEFCGYKHPLFDAAHFIGCCGFENPEFLFSPFVKSFSANLAFPQDMKAKIPEIILAGRFLWLSYWLALRDEDLISLEKEYISLLFKNIEMYRDSLR
ncbi:MAG: phosphotransferase [Fibrobacterota bacterium]